MIFREGECFRNKYIYINLLICFCGISPEINYIDHLVYLCFVFLILLKLVMSFWNAGCLNLICCLWRSQPLFGDSPESVYCESSVQIVCSILHQCLTLTFICKQCCEGIWSVSQKMRSLLCWKKKILQHIWVRFHPLYREGHGTVVVVSIAKPLNR